MVLKFNCGRIPGLRRDRRPAPNRGHEQIPDPCRVRDHDRDLGRAPFLVRDSICCRSFAFHRGDSCCYGSHCIFPGHVPCGNLLPGVLFCLLQAFPFLLAEGGSSKFLHRPHPPRPRPRPRPLPGPPKSPFAFSSAEIVWTAPPSTRIAHPWTRAAAVLRRASARMRPAVARDTFIISPTCSWERPSRSAKRMASSSSCPRDTSSNWRMGTPAGLK